MSTDAKTFGLTGQTSKKSPHPNLKVVCLAGTTPGVGLGTRPLVIGLVDATLCFILFSFCLLVFLLVSNCQSFRSFQIFY